jgi:chromatin segregation and condensation protein Rec8/ScpA/Scc1 (kleisin family)
MSRVFRDRADECRELAELFRAEKAREHLLKVAADYESMADRAAIFELQDADRERIYSRRSPSEYWHRIVQLNSRRPSISD